MSKPEKLPPSPSPVEALAQSLEDSLTRQWGPVLTGEALRLATGFRSPESLRQAISQGKMPIPVFPIEHRRGKYALTKMVARWLAESALGASAAQKEQIAQGR